MTVENISISVRTNADKAATKINALSLALERLEGTAKTTQGAAQSVSGAMNNVAPAGANAASGAKSAARGIDDVAKSAKKAQSPMGNFISSLKRIAFYRLLRTIIKEISQAIKEGIDNLYEFSKANNDFGGVASALDSLASSAQKTKNQLGATFGQMLVALTPALNSLLNLVNKITEALYPLVQVLKLLEPAITAVIKVATELVDVLIALFDLLGLNEGKIVADDVAASWKEADKAAKKYKNTILGFDEINRLNDIDDDSKTNGTFSFSPAAAGNDFEYKTPNWIIGLNDDIDNTRGKLGELVAEMVAIPEAEANLVFNDEATEPLHGAIRTIMESSPYVAYLQLAILGNPIPLIQSIRSAITELLSGSPYIVKVKSEIADILPQIQTITQGVKQEVAELQGVFQQAFSAIAQFVNSLSESYAENVNNIQVENATLGQDVVDTYNRLKNPLNGWVSHFWEKVGEYQQAGSALQVENETLAGDMADTFDAIKQSFSKFKNETLLGWAAWASSVAESARLAFVNVAQNVYGGLKNAAENIVIWVKGTAQSFGEWAKSNIQAFIGWAKSVLNVIGNALSSAWSAIKSFFKGETDIRPKTGSELFNQLFDFTGDIRGGTIPMIPYSSGVVFSMPIPAFASGGFPTPGDLFIANERGSELVGTMNGKPAVANNQEIVNGIAAGNVDVVNAVYAIGNMIVKAVNDIDPDITLDGERLANKMYRYNQAAARRYGGAMVEA